MFLDGVDRDDVRMGERGNRACLALETVAKARIGRPGRVEDLERDEAIEPFVPRFVDLAHAAGAEPADNHVGTEPGAGGQRHRQPE